MKSSQEQPSSHEHIIPFSPCKLKALALGQGFYLETPKFELPWLQPIVTGAKQSSPSMDMQHTLESYSSSSNPYFATCGEWFSYSYCFLTNFLISFGERNFLLFLFLHQFLLFLFSSYYSNSYSVIPIPIIEQFGLEVTIKGYLVQPSCNVQEHFQLDLVAPVLIPVLRLSLSFIALIIDA